MISADLMAWYQLDIRLPGRSSMPHRNLSPVELAILRSLVSMPAGALAMKLAAPWAALERLERACMIAYEHDGAQVTVTSLGRQSVARAAAERESWGKYDGG